MKLTPAQLKKMMPSLDERQRAALAAQGVTDAGTVKTEKAPRRDYKVRSPHPVLEESHSWRLEVPVKLLSESNYAGSTRAKIGRKVAQKAIVRDHLAVHGIRPVDLSKGVVRLTFFNKFRMTRKPDHTNLKSRFKAVEDAVVQWLGFDDADHPSLHIEMGVGKHPEGQNTVVISFSYVRHEDVQKAGRGRL
jgi:hypothetical protein